MIDWQSLLKNSPPLPLLPKHFTQDNAYTFTLSHPSDFSNIDPLNTAAMIKRTNMLLRQHQASWGIGLYGEQRNLYQHPQYSRKPVIHLGCDLSVPAGTPLFAPINATIHSFQDNAQPGDYGPTLILQHQLSSFTFYSLYGHLSRSSLTFYQKKKTFIAGEKIGEVGSTNENGDWPTHVHMQIILDMSGHQGNYPGVCELNEQTYYLANCPNPDCILRLA